ncbi:MAG: hypothetical protein FWG33_04810 [Oscillospiraceae bacterium]|nr:hypothetical protein [Oscillospiraceae bacterium]
MIDINKYSETLNKIQPKYAEAVFPVGQCPVPLIGEDIQRHLHGSKSVLVCAATLGEEFDRILRRLQLEDMAGAVILDSASGVYLEDFLDKKTTGNRYSPGYGDFPLSVNRDIIAVLNASTRIGLCVTDEYVLTPQKSITGLVGIK